MPEVVEVYTVFRVIPLDALELLLQLLDRQGDINHPGQG
jgi:hypothetical protein